MSRFRYLSVLAVMLAARYASAEDVAGKLARYEDEARQITAQLPQANELGGNKGQMRLVDAEAAFAVGNYDSAALALFDLFDRQVGPDKQAAAYYLAESLLQKGDRGTARQYFQAAIAGGPAGHYYVPSEQALLDIAIAENDPAAGADALRALDSAAAGTGQLPYLHGRLAFTQGKYDEAVGYFNQVAKGSEFELQALYATAAAAVAKKDLAGATDKFTELASRHPKSANDHRVVELSQLALGRVYYERGEPAKSIDAYLAIDRHSDLFPDALYEVGWVYVKGKQFDKALRALELLEQSEPASVRTPTVRILEGNLRIRKAQILRQQQIDGTINNDERSSPSLEYDKAAQIFSDTHDQYYSSYAAMKQLVDSKADPKVYIDQIAGRSEHVFQLAAPLPEMATQMLHDDPNISVFIGIEEDLANVRTSIEATQTAMSQLDAQIGSRDHSKIYPALAERRSRIADMQDDLVAIRAQIADQANNSSAQAATRRALVQQYAALGKPELAYQQRELAQHQSFDQLSQNAADIDGAISSAQAVAVAVRKYAGDSAAVTADQKTNALSTIDVAGAEAQQIEEELAQVRRDIALGNQMVGVNDDQIAQARALRDQCKAAEDAELADMAGHGQSNDLAQRAARLADTLTQLDATIVATAEQGIAQAKVAIDSDRKLLADLQQEATSLDQQARDQGANGLDAAFQGVTAKLYDIVIRADVGGVDVAWSSKEDSDDDLKRLNLVRSREIKQLKDEFKDILDETVQAPTAPKKRVLPPISEGVQQSPDKGAGDRIRPVDNSGTGTGTAPPPLVKPEDNPPANKATPPTQPAKKGATP